MLDFLNDCLKLGHLARFSVNAQANGRANAQGMLGGEVLDFLECHLNGQASNDPAPVKDGRDETLTAQAPHPSLPSFRTGTLPCRQHNFPCHHQSPPSRSLRVFARSDGAVAASSVGTG